MKSFFIKALITLLCVTTFLHAKEGPLKVAVIGGIVASGMWDKIADAFEKRYGIKTEIAVSGNKKILDAYVRKNSVDLVTMHSSDTISNLVADGLFEDLIPWVRNAQMIVGVRTNPAAIEPDDTLTEALKKIQQSKASFVIHPSGGTFEVFHAVKERYNFTPNTIFLKRKGGFFKEVVAKDGYTLFGVIPFLLKKHHNPMIKGYYREDESLKRPYLAAIAKNKKAKKLLEFLTSNEIQNIISSYRIDGFEKYPVFFAVKNTDKKEK